MLTFQILLQCFVDSCSFLKSKFYPKAFELSTFIFPYCCFFFIFKIKSSIILSFPFFIHFTLSICSYFFWRLIRRSTTLKFSHFLFHYCIPCACIFTWTFWLETYWQNIQFINVNTRSRCFIDELFYDVFSYMLFSFLWNM